MQRRAIVVAVACIGLGLGACQKEQAPAAVKAFSGAANVITAAVSQGEIFKAYQAVASIEPIEIAKIVPKVGGRVRAIRVAEGSQVSRGEELMQLDSFGYDQSRQNASGALKQAEAGLVKARRDFERMSALHQSSAISEQSFQDAQTAYRLAQAQLEQARAGLNLAGDNLAECSVRAPIAGLVTLKAVNVGEMVSQERPSFVIEDMRRVKLLVALPEEAYATLRVGNACLVTADAFAGEHFEGRISKIYPSIDPLSRTFKVEVAIPNSDLRLRSGMTARTRVVLAAREQALSVPTAALLQDEEGYYVYVVR